MKAFFDTSVLLAALVRVHPSHAPSQRWLQQVAQGEVQGYISSHGIAEVYAKLTSVPFQPRIKRQEAHDLLNVRIRNLLEPIALTGTECWQVVDHMVAQGFIGGIVYDALLVYASIRANVDVVLTLNARHFRQIYPEMATRIIDPAETPPTS
jgi:predicted nucleic acid-binding protein